MAHYNRNNRRSGGDKRFTINVPELTKKQRLEIVIQKSIDKHPEWTVQEIGDWAVKYTGATMDEVFEILDQYCED